MLFLLGETCNDGEMIAKEKFCELENTKGWEEKTDTRNWFKKKDQFKKENIQQIKFEEDTVSGEGIIDLTEEITPSKIKEEEMAVQEKG